MIIRLLDFIGELGCFCCEKPIFDLKKEYYMVRMNIYIIVLNKWHVNANK